MARRTSVRSGAPPDGLERPGHGRGWRTSTARPLLPFLLGGSYALLGVAWILGNPAAAAPDEPAHYLKALAVASGQPAGRPVDVSISPSEPKQSAWMKRTTRAVDVPPGLSPVGLQCNALQPSESARCQADARPPAQASRGLTYVGTHQPLLYVLPGALAHAAHEPVTAIRLARLGTAATSLGLVFASIALLWDRRRRALSLLGLAFAVTPMVVFLASSVSTSGPEIAASICFCAALLRLGRRPASSGATWAALGVSGVVLASSRSLGPLWVVALGVVFAVHGKLTVASLRAGGWAAVGSVSAVVVAAFGTVAWELVVQRRGGLAARELGRWLLPSLGEVSKIWRQQIGVFGSLDAALPPIAYRWWTLMLLLLLSFAFVAGSGRDRAALLVLAATGVGLTVVISALNRAQTGFGMQGRYVLPATVALPLLAAETLVRRRRDGGRLALGTLTTLLWVPVAATHGLSWYVNARRSAVGDDVEWAFLAHSEWSPEVGWYPLLAVVTLAVALMATLALPALGGLLSPSRVPAS